MSREPNTRIVRIPGQRGTVIHAVYLGGASTNGTLAYCGRLREDWVKVAGSEWENALYRCQGCDRLGSACILEP